MRDRGNNLVNYTVILSDLVRLQGTTKTLGTRLMIEKQQLTLIGCWVGCISTYWFILGTIASSFIGIGDCEICIPDTFSTNVLMFGPLPERKHNFDKFSFWQKVLRNRLFSNSLLMKFDSQNKRIEPLWKLKSLYLFRYSRPN